MKEKTYFLDEKEVQKIDAHYTKYFELAGAVKDDLILHEVESDGMHIDLVHFFPSDKFPYHIYATIGMSAYPMPQSTFKNMELIMLLPREWKTSMDDLKENKWWWPLKTLKDAARLPYWSDSFLDFTHTFSIDSGRTPFDETTKMCAALITLPECFDFGFFELKTGGFLSKKKINFFCVTAITSDELDKIAEVGVQKFMEEILLVDGKTDIVTRAER